MITQGNLIIYPESNFNLFLAQWKLLYRIKLRWNLNKSFDSINIELDLKVCYVIFHIFSLTLIKRKSWKIYRFFFFWTKKK